MSLRRRTIAVFLLALSLYGLTYKGVSAGDDLFHLVAVKGWLQGRLALPAELGAGLPRSPNAFFVAKGRHEQVHLALPPGLGLASMPLAKVGQWRSGADLSTEAEVVALSKFKAPPEEVMRALRDVRRQPEAFSAGLINPIVTAATIALFHVLVTWLGASRPTALASSGLLGMATIVWPYATTYWSQPIAGFCLLGAVAGLFRFEQTGRPWPAAWAGLACGYGILTRTELVLAVPWALLYVWLATSGRPRRRATAFLAFAAPLLACATLWMGWNWVRFGDVLQTGSIHQRRFTALIRPSFLLQSVPAQLVSFPRSVFVFSPPLLLAVAAWPSFVRRWRLFGATTLGLIATLFLFYSAFIMWNAAASWGPRFLVPLTALALLPLGVWLEGGRNRIRAAVVLGTLGLIVQSAIAFPGYRVDAVAAYWGTARPSLAVMFFKSDVVVQLRALVSGEMDVWWLWTAWSPLVAAGLFVVFVAAGAAVVAARREPHVDPGRGTRH